MRDGWVATILSPCCSVSEDGLVTCQMALNVGPDTDTDDATVAFQMPPNLLPGAEVRTVAWGENGFAKVVLDGFGQLLVFGVGTNTFIAFTLTYRLR
ncbi:hypothetical protein [Methylorubrum extorquens]